jgi:hypothetical protein
LALFDPAAVLDVINTPQGNVRVRQEAQRGNLLLYLPGGNGEIRFQVYVDEDPHPGLLARADARHCVEKRLLRAPSGRLFAAGAEHLGSKVPVSAEEFSVPEHSGCCREIPKGNYLVSAFEVNWGDEEQRWLRAAAGKWAIRVETTAGVVAGVLIVAHVFGLPIVLWAVYCAFGWPGVWTVLKWVVSIDIIAAAGVLSVFRFPMIRRVEALREAHRRRSPDVVVVLRSLSPDQPSSGANGALGPASPIWRQSFRGGRSQAGASWSLGTR